MPEVAFDYGYFTNICIFGFNANDLGSYCRVFIYPDCEIPRGMGENGSVIVEVLERPRAKIWATCSENDTWLRLRISPVKITC